MKPGPGTTAAAPLPESGSVVGIDFGLRRTGLAVGDLALGIAHPLEQVATADAGTRLDAIARCIRDWAPVALVLGWPVRDDGKVHDMAAAVGAFQAAIESRFALPVIRVDERFSSSAAAEALSDAGVRGRRQKDHLDSLAAQAILQGFLDERRAAA